MISLPVIFFIFVFFFALIGALRGWAQELLVSFSVILTLFLILIMQNYIGVIITPFTDLDREYQPEAVPGDENVRVFVIPAEELKPFGDLPDDAQKAFRRQFWFRAAILTVLVFFGYQTPALTRLGGDIRREKIQDALLGFFLGSINAYLVIGTLWSYMHLAHYPFEPYILAPQPNDPFFSTTSFLVGILPPAWLGTTPTIFLAIGLAFLFVLVVFI